MAVNFAKLPELLRRQQRCEPAMAQLLAAKLAVVAVLRS